MKIGDIRSSSEGLIATGRRPAVSGLTKTGLLELFAPSPPGEIPGRRQDQVNEDVLWQSDAIHRARNLAQLAVSLAAVGEHRSRGWLEPDLAGEIKALSRSYEELADEMDRSIPVPCVEPLEDIVTGLIRIFGVEKGLTSDISVAPVVLLPDQRRALVLMASELVVNALKYGYPEGHGGTIAVSLHDTEDGIELVIEDDGVGAVDGYIAGNGGGLLDRLSAILGAEVSRGRGKGGRGFRVCVHMVHEPRNQSVA